MKIFSKEIQNTMTWFSRPETLDQTGWSKYLDGFIWASYYRWLPSSTRPSVLNPDAGDSFAQKHESIGNQCHWNFLNHTEIHHHHHHHHIPTIIMFIFLIHEIHHLLSTKTTKHNLCFDWTSQHHLATPPSHCDEQARRGDVIPIACWIATTTQLPQIHDRQKHRI